MTSTFPAWLLSELRLPCYNSLRIPIKFKNSPLSFSTPSTKLSSTTCSKMSPFSNKSSSKKANPSLLKTDLISCGTLTTKLTKTLSVSSSNQSSKCFLPIWLRKSTSTSTKKSSQSRPSFWKMSKSVDWPRFKLARILTYSSSAWFQSGWIKDVLL